MVSISSKDLDRNGVVATRPLAKRLTEGLVTKTVEALLKAKRRKLARRLLLKTVRSLDRNPKTDALVARAWNGVKSPKYITDIRADHLKGLMQRPIRRSDYARLLTLMARYEAIGRNAPVAAGDIIGRQLVSDVGRSRIRAAADKALKQAPRSPLLIYLKTACMAKEGDYDEASRLLGQRINMVAHTEGASIGERKRLKQEFESLRNAWRVVDLIAREDTGWLDGEKGNTYSALAKEDTATQGGATTQSWSLTFKEPLLQSRDETAYLALCQSEFDAAPTLLIKLKVIKEMIRQGVRRQLTYHNAYRQANGCFDQCRQAIEQLLDTDPDHGIATDRALLVVQSLVLAIELVRALERTDELETYKTRLFELALTEPFTEARWVALPALVMDDPEVWFAKSRVLRQSIERDPANERDLKAYLIWAMHTRAFQAADTLFHSLPAALRGSPAALFYVNILQRQSRFTDALNVLKRIHAYMLAKPARLNPYQHWALIRRYGEMSFLRQTANIYKSVRQPKKPVGVIILGARNIDQLPKYPLVVLTELKRHGWAIVPLVEGLLPREKTGIEAIDALNGCITIENRLRPEVEWKIDPVDDFISIPEQGIIKFGPMDLGHSVLEDARINRRAFNVDLTCPALVANTRRLGVSTELFARALDYTRDKVVSEGYRVGLMCLFNSRLPDTLFRFYCDHYGDEHNFYCLHTANGYENYFKNFKTTISTRCVIRNVTKYPEVRASSMPVPRLFEKYYQTHLGQIDRIYERIEEIANVRRTTGNNINTPLDPKMMEAEKRIMDWRAKGGKVACLFGRVVCDSAVPFDGGPAHVDLVDWLNHSIDAVRDSNTLLIIKPHPHELTESIATYLNEYFTDLITVPIPDNVIVFGHRWFDIQSLKAFVDLGLLYNGTTAIELALNRIPAVLCGHFGPVDYPVGHAVPESRAHYEALLRFEHEAKLAEDIRARAAMWLDYMSTSSLILDYRFHSRPVTNKKVYPPYWVQEDLEDWRSGRAYGAKLLAKRAIGQFNEPAR